MSLFKKEKNHISVKNMNNEMYEYQSEIEGIFSKKAKKELLKRNFLSKETVFFLEFKGDVMASNVKNLRNEVSAILLSAKANDEVLISIESAGGTVTGYGLVSEQLDRLRNKGIKITAVVDEVAASGGYMMACVANEIVVAKRAVIGSIGVVVGMPNYESILDKIGVKYNFYTAGEKKVGITPYKKASPEQEIELKEDLESIHNQFKTHIQEYRPNLNIEELSTGEVWSGVDAVENGLADRLGISDDEVFTAIQNGKLVLKISYEIPKTKKSFLSYQVSQITSTAFDVFYNKIINIAQNKTIKKW